MQFCVYNRKGSLNGTGSQVKFPYSPFIGAISDFIRTEGGLEVLIKSEDA